MTATGFYGTQWSCATTVIINPDATGVAGPPTALTYGLYQNAPNPFRCAATIPFLVPAPGKVTIGVYDVAGRMVSTVADEYHEAGSFSAVWDGRDSSGRSVGAWVYFVRMVAGEFLATRKIIVLD